MDSEIKEIVDLDEQRDPFRVHQFVHNLDTGFSRPTTRQLPTTVSLLHAKYD